jgi:hypothetical protein
MSILVIALIVALVAILLACAAVLVQRWRRDSAPSAQVPISNPMFNTSTNVFRDPSGSSRPVSTVGSAIGGEGRTQARDSVLISDMDGGVEYSIPLEAGPEKKAPSPAPAVYAAMPDRGHVGGAASGGAEYAHLDRRGVGNTYAALDTSVTYGAATASVPAGPVAYSVLGEKKEEEKKKPTRRLSGDGGGSTTLYAVPGAARPHAYTTTDAYTA